MKYLKDNQEEEKKGYWKRQTLTAKILLVIFAIFVIGIVAVVALVMTAPQVTAVNITDAKNADQEMTKLEINGTSDPGAVVKINNAQVTADNNGKWTYNLTDIATGNTNVNITAKIPNKQSATIIIIVTRTVTEGSAGTLYHLEWHWNGTVTPGP